jgi:hypothetical protein
MAIKPNMILIFSIFLLVVISTLIIFFVPVINALSSTQPNQLNNTFFAKDTNKSQIDDTSNPTLLKQLGLYSLYQHLNNTISGLITLAENPLNGSISFENFPLVNLTNEMKITYHGVPSDQDIEKRNVARDALANNKALLAISLLLPNGDRYFSEPYYPYQTNGSIFNFAHRDHFEGVMETKKPYLSNVLTAATTGEPIAILASPIYADLENQDSIIAGIQILTLNFSYFNDWLKSEIPTEGVNDTVSNKRVVIVDSNGTKIADSSSIDNDSIDFKDLQSFQNAKVGRTGFIIEAMGDNNLTISYAPIDFAQSKWILLSMSTQ